ncbi:MAG: hypothetical protein U1B80_07600 [Anaerolineaceae bacterium]|nr:hypothetical protein [Anaerolineaceae bacterium]
MRLTKKMIARLAVSLALAGLFIGVVQDLNARFAPVMGAGERIPRSLMVAGTFVLFSLIVLALAIWKPGVFAPLQRLRARVGWWRWLPALVVIALPTIFFVFTKWSEVFEGSYIRTLAYFFPVAVAAWLASGDENKLIEWQTALACIVIFGAVFSIGNGLRNVVSYPFSFGWSEGNRLWDYSILYGRRFFIYPPDEPLRSLTNQARQSLWGLPFLFTRPSIQFMRLWDVLVFSLPYILLGLFVFRSEMRRPATWLVLGLWTFIFLDQGPIYTPLILAAILVVAARREPLGWALGLVFLAGYYARFSRSTWLAAPAVWAFSITLLDVHFWNAQARPLQRWVRPIALAIAGGLGGVVLPELIQRLQAAAQGRQPGAPLVSIEGITGTVTRQPLIWERLLPNPTYPPGIVLGLLMATAPLMALIGYVMITHRWRLDRWQKMTLAGSLLAFLVVGLIVSVKIGGGSNLHNLDMYLISLVIVAGFAWDAGGREVVMRLPAHRLVVGALALAAVIIPASHNIYQADSLRLPPPQQVSAGLDTINQYVAQYKTEGEVLFIDQRQLLTFGDVHNVPLVAEYEKKVLMDYAMAADEAYFDPFFRDLAAHRFSVIISEPLWVNFRGADYDFGLENDSWVRWVSIPVLCYYEPVETNMVLGFQILLPKDKEAPDPGVECPPY